MTGEDKKNSTDNESTEQSGEAGDQDEKKRKARRRLLTAAGIAGSGSLMEWHRPVIESVMAPAHADVSATPRPTPQPTDMMSTNGPTPMPTGVPQPTQ